MLMIESGITAKELIKAIRGAFTKDQRLIVRPHKYNDDVVFIENKEAE